MLGHDGVPKGTTDFRTILTKVARQSPGCALLWRHHLQRAPVARKQMNDAGLNIPFMGGDGIVNDEFTKMAGRCRRQLRDRGGGERGDAARSQAVPGRLQEPINADVGSYSANGYEATNIISRRSRRRARRTARRSGPRIAATKDFKGVIGTTSFDENGDTTNRWISIYQAKGGKWEFVDQLKIGQ